TIRGKTAGGSRAGCGGTNATTTSLRVSWCVSSSGSPKDARPPDLDRYRHPRPSLDPMPTIDLRSDTVTRPSPAMRRAMAEAEVGDDVFLEDPTLNLLQERAAAVFGREAALFVPTGSMGNLISLIAQTRPGQEVICETNGHIYNYEMGALAALAGLLPRVVNGEDGLLSW